MRAFKNIWKLFFAAFLLFSVFEFVHLRNSTFAGDYFGNEIKEKVDGLEKNNILLNVGTSFTTSKELWEGSLNYIRIPWPIGIPARVSIVQNADGTTYTEEGGFLTVLVPLFGLALGLYVWISWICKLLPRRSQLPTEE